MYDHLLRYPVNLSFSHLRCILIWFKNLPCTNAPMALLCELVADLKSTINSLRHSTEPEPSDGESRRRSNRKGYRSKTETKSQDRKHQPAFLVNLKVTSIPMSFFKFIFFDMYFILRPIFDV